MNNIPRLLFSAILCFIYTAASAQGINGYAAVTAVAGSTITVNSVDETDDTFEDGEYVIIMQMQDDVIGNTTNSALFGDLGTIQSAGLYEVRQIASHTETTGIPATITFTQAPTNTYNINSNSRVQVITFPSFGAPDYTTVTNMSPTAWNGTIGGVLAFDVPGILTLSHDITADAAGFRGGADDVAASGGGGACESSIYISVNSTRALKGEGIYRNTNSAYEAARGKILNGGGGGSSHNGGGAGGGNYTVGGDGGIGWGCQSTPTVSAGGIGGISLLTNISSSRIFMGGGGGAGERNNAFATGGGNGGGIIIIKASEIETSGACGGLTISSNGESTPDIGNDGMGGAGAGGSIFLDVDTYSVAAGCALTVEASGGDGGSSLSGGIHGGGGGGGQGVVIYSIIEPTTNITTITSIGTGGCGNTSSPCNSVAGSGGGSVGDGIVDASTSGPLPVSLTYFKASKRELEDVLLEWETQSESNNDFFQIEKSVDGETWKFLAKIEGAGNSPNVNFYEITDRAPQFGVNYYRLSQIDFDGTLTQKGIESVFIENKNNNVFTVFPNPSKGIVFVESSSGDNIKSIRIQNMMGQEIAANTYWVNGLTEVDMSSLGKGVYLVEVRGNKGSVQTLKVVLK
ncbi:MAG: T9SS type A sorting domain-containing protein [Crocinitomicaceae bacterium]